MTQNTNLALACAPQNMEQLWKFSQTAAKTNLVPNVFRNKPEDCYIAIQMGLELGLKPLQALSGIAVVNGKPTLYGDALIALVRAFEQCEYVVEEFDESTMTATCRAKRKGQPEQATSFSKADAQTAKLWGKQGPWTQYPKRMLQMRARGFGLRDVFPDALLGVITREEAEDYPTEKPIEVRDVTPSAKVEVGQTLTQEAEELKKKKVDLKDKLAEMNIEPDLERIEKAASKTELLEIFNEAIADQAQDLESAPAPKADENAVTAFWAAVEAEDLDEFIPVVERAQIEEASAERLVEILENVREMKTMGDA